MGIEFLPHTWIPNERIGGVAVGGLVSMLSASWRWVVAVEIGFLALGGGGGD